MTQSDDAVPNDTRAPWPSRSLRDAGAIKAMAHPLRLRLLELLGAQGPATATDLAARVGESPANCSWHLRQLAAHGFIEDTGEGKGRQRYWRFVPESTHFSDVTDDPHLAAAGRAGGEAMLEYVVAELRQWRVDRTAESPRWREASFSNHSLAWLTADELEELSAEITELVLRHADRFTDRTSRPPGSRPVRIYATGIPARSLEDPSTAENASDVTDTD